MYSLIFISLCLCLSVTALPSRQKRQYGSGGGTCQHRCVPYYQCSGDGNIISDGAGIIDVRVGPGSGGETKLVGGNCPDILEVCCKDPNAPIISTKPPYIPKCGRHLEEGSLDIRIHLNQTLHHFTNVAQFGAYPWMVAILNHDPHKKVNVYQCGGSLIHPQVVLTAAHCVDKIDKSSIANLKVRLGEWDTQQTQDHPYLKHQDINAKDVVLHKNYRRQNLFNDVALIFLEKPAILDYHIDTICLPEPGQNYDGLDCYATGWGKDQYGIGNWQAILKEIDLPVVPRKYCQNLLRDSRLGCGFCLHDTFLCAGGVPGKDTCEGDGGSPLVCYDPRQGNYVQAGIVAWGIGCGSTLPGVYVDVSRYYDWITLQVQKYFSDGYFNVQQDYGINDIPYSEEEYGYCLRNIYSPEYNQYKSGHPCQFKKSDGTYAGQQTQPYQGR